VSLQTSGVSSKTSGFALNSAKTANSPIFTTDEHRWTQIVGRARHSVRAGLGNQSPAASKGFVLSVFIRVHPWFNFQPSTLNQQQIK
jgi:hypothetical protein